MIKRTRFYWIFALTCAALCAFTACMVCVGGVFAAFSYARSEPEEKSVLMSGSIAEFSYAGADMDDACKETVEIAIDGENGLNGSSYLGFHLFIAMPEYLREQYGRHQFGYVGSMDDHDFKFGTPEGVSFVMTLPTGDEPIYLYLVSLSKAELNAKNVGEILTDVYRVKIEKNADGLYEQTEVKKGSSPVTVYEYKYCIKPYTANAFAIYQGEIVWQES